MSSGTAEILERSRPADPDDLRKKADWIRLQTIELIDAAGLGHYSSTFSCAEILAVLYYHSLRLCPSDPQYPERDRFLLGKGHVAVGLWPIFAELGFYTQDLLSHYGETGAALNDHPNMRTAPGIDFSSGSLGHNLSVGVGMALAGRLQGHNYRTFVLTGDGELQEGTVWEAAMAGSHHKLGNLVAIVDANRFSGGGPTSQAMNIEPLRERFASFGWDAFEIDGNDVDAVMEAFDGLPDDDTDVPTCIIARTHKGKGLKAMEESPQAWHLGVMSPEQREAAIREIEARLR